MTKSDKLVIISKKRIVSRNINKSINLLVKLDFSLSRIFSF